MKRATSLALTIACVGLGACSRDLDMPNPEPDPPRTVSFQLQNDGATTAFVYESCIVDFTITSLANPSAPITRVAGCVCTCDQAPQCPVCGPCFEGPREIAAGTAMTAYWLTASVTTERGGACQRLDALPAGSYRIDLPVYPTLADAMAKMFPRTVTQTFTLPAPDDTVTIPVATAP
jgi:hypothetical protein